MKMKPASEIGALTRGLVRAGAALSLLVLVQVCAAEGGAVPETSAPPSSAGQPASGTEDPGGKGEPAPSPEARPATLAVDEIRAAQDQALQRRSALLKPEMAIADPEERKQLLERWGVEVMGTRIAAGGYMIDFRFRVLDADKALPLFDSKIQPYLLRQGSDIKLPVPVGQKVGAFRTTDRGKNIQAGKDYYIMFANPDSYVKPGQRVSVVIGDFRVNDLTIQ